MRFNVEKIRSGVTVESGSVASGFNYKMNITQILLVQ